MRVVSPAATRHGEPDQACAAAVDLARATAEEDAGPDQIGEHVGVEAEGDRVVTHLFASLNPAYVGWRWAVTVSRAARAKVVTVSESMLLPGPDSLLAPPWVPWTERVRPGDLKAGDLMPASFDDERLVPFVALEGEAGLLDWDETDMWRFGGERRVVAPSRDASAGDAAGAGDASDAAETAGTPETAGAARAAPVLRPRRVLSAIGRDETAVRWYTGEPGPASPLASSAPATCLTCGFMVRLSGRLGRVFGVCANELAPDDGKVVSVDHGCGAHSDGDIIAADAGRALPAVDELGYDMLNTGSTVPDSVLETLDHELA
jgi:hypothetical protein